MRPALALAAVGQSCATCGFGGNGDAAASPGCSTGAADPDARDEHGLTPLLQAEREGRHEVARLLRVRSG